MYLVAIAWMYVVVMMAVAEGTAANGTFLGAIVTLLLYGLGPVALVVYLMGAPARSRAIKAREALLRSGQPDAGGHAPAAAEGDGIAPVRKEP